MSFATTFDALNAKAAAVGASVYCQLVEEKDLGGLRRLMEETTAMYDGIVNFIEKRVEYAEWREWLNRTNDISCMHQLDRTGEFTRLVKEMKEKDAEGYFFTVIKPLIIRGTVPVYQERDMVQKQMKVVFDAIVEERRKEMQAI